MCDLQGVHQDVLPIRRAVLQPPQGSHQLLVEVVYPDLEGGLFASLTDLVLDLGLGLLVHLFDARGLDTAIAYELLQRQPGYLAANRIEAR